MRTPRTLGSPPSISGSLLACAWSMGCGARRSCFLRAGESTMNPRRSRRTCRCLASHLRSNPWIRMSTSTPSKKRNGRYTRGRSSKSISPIASRFRCEGRPPPRTSASGNARPRRSEDSSRPETTACCPRVRNGSSESVAAQSRPDLVRATFPGGSITGAPKPRAMEIIERLEPHRRGVYTGAIGYISWDRSVDWNIAIRTATVIGETAYFAVGGGIVADSDPYAEYQETLDKLRGHAEALTQDRVEVTPDGLRVA